MSPRLAHLESGICNLEFLPPAPPSEAARAKKKLDSLFKIWLRFSESHSGDFKPPGFLEVVAGLQKASSVEVVGEAKSPKKGPRAGRGVPPSPSFLRG